MCVTPSGGRGDQRPNTHAKHAPASRREQLAAGQQRPRQAGGLLQAADPQRQHRCQGRYHRVVGGAERGDPCIQDDKYCGGGTPCLAVVWRGHDGPCV